jgi:hypothetical protein
MARGNDVSPQASRRVRELSSRFAESFDAAAIHNTVHDDVLEDQDLALMLDAAFRAEEVEKYREADDDVADALLKGWGKLSWAAEQRVQEVVAQSCATVIQEGDDWTDAWDEAAIAAAKHEAREWLQVNTNAADRAGVLDGIEDDIGLDVVVCSECNRFAASKDDVEHTDDCPVPEREQAQEGGQ